MKARLYLRNQQRVRRVNRKYLAGIIESLLRGELRCESYALAVYLVDATTMARINETHLRHRGPTDVIAFDYADSASPALLAGEVFVCVDEAVRQAPKYETTWQSELVRYAAHGILHLCGYDDQKPAARRKMKARESAVVRLLASRFDFARIGWQRSESHRGLPHSKTPTRKPTRSCVR